jgi:hypothetical protein
MAMAGGARVPAEARTHDHPISQSSIVRSVIGVPRLVLRPAGRLS